MAEKWKRIVEMKPEGEISTSDQEKFERINSAVKKYALEGDKNGLVGVTSNELKRAKAFNHLNQKQDWFKYYDVLITEMDKEIKDTIEIHKHYRGIAIGYTATIITLSLVQIRFLDGLLNKQGNTIVKFVAEGPFIVSILLSVVSQFRLFCGYLSEARGNIEKANTRYFGPTDKIVRDVMRWFLIGTGIVALLQFKVWALFSLVVATYFYKRYGWDKKSGQRVNG